MEQRILKMQDMKTREEGGKNIWKGILLYLVRRMRFGPDG